MSRYLNIVCINNSEFPWELTVGKTYKAERYVQRDDGYVIKEDDKGRTGVFFYAFRFKTESQLAKERQILDDDLFRF